MLLGESTYWAYHTQSSLFCFFAIFLLNHMLLAACIAQEPLLLVLLAAKKCDLETLLAHSLGNLSVSCCNASRAGGEGLVFCCHLRPARCNSRTSLLPMSVVRVRGCCTGILAFDKKLEGFGNLSFILTFPLKPYCPPKVL